MNMFCYQCEQTAKGHGCTHGGVCGKDPRTAALQDVLVHVTKGISQYAFRAERYGINTKNADHFVVEALFTTVTNVNFDEETLAIRIYNGIKLRDAVRAEYEKACADAGETPEEPDGPAVWQPEKQREALIEQAGNIGIVSEKQEQGDDIAGLLELIMYGLKGMAAYTDHARILGVEDDAVYRFFHETLDILNRKEHTVDALLTRALKCGEVNIRIMEMLDQANTGAYGHPEPTDVRITPKKGKCILVSGHDLKDLETLLKQTEGKEINVYTHGEMLPCNAYPGLKKYQHLIGNYGGAWQDQQKEFDAFPGAILMTTNCIQKPRDSYKERIFTSGLVQWPGVTHISDGIFSPVINAALSAPGFSADEEEKTITIGFGHNAVMNVAETIIDAVKSGAIRHFFLIGGCDGAKPGRNYYTEAARVVPDDCVILTLACGKYRFNKEEFGDIGGIPRLIDCGQCNDAYSAIKIAEALANAFDCGVNDLPLSMILSWYEQKAVCILLSLLHLNIQGIRLGPTLPAFLTPAAVNILVDAFAIAPVTTPEKDIAACLST